MNVNQKLAISQFLALGIFLQECGVSPWNLDAFWSERKHQEQPHAWRDGLFQHAPDRRYDTGLLTQGLAVKNVAA
jgi:hypothetical protein